MTDDPKVLIVDTCRRMIHYGLTYASLGNVSVRRQDKIFITPSGVRFDELTPSMIVIVDLDGRVLSGGRPSVELPMHLEVYRNIDDAMAVIHAHSLYSTVLGSIVDSRLVFKNEEAKIMGIDNVIVCQYAPSGTWELAHNVTRALKQGRATIIPHHGVVVYGESLSHALSVLETLENLSKMRILESILRYVRV